MTFPLRKAIMKRSLLKIKKIKTLNLLIKQLIRQRNLVVKLNKEAKKSFLKKQITENATSRTKSFWKAKNYANLFSLKKVFIINRNLLLKLRDA